MGRKIRSKKFSGVKDKTSRKVRAAVKNTQHKALGLESSTAAKGCDAERRVGVTLRKFKSDVFFGDVVQWSESKCKKLLQQYDVIGRSGDKLTCWQCDKRLVASTRGCSSTGSETTDLLQCPSCRTASRHALELPWSSLAYSPFWRSMRRGFTPQFALWMRVAFAVGVKMPTDTMLHVVQDQAHAVSTELLDRWVREINHALAWHEYKLQENILLKDEIIEIDGAKVATHKKTGKARHMNRLRRSKTKVGKRSSQSAGANASSKRSWTPGRLARSLPKRGDKRPQVHHGRAMVSLPFFGGGLGEGRESCERVTQKPRHAVCPWTLLEEDCDGAYASEGDAAGGSSATRGHSFRPEGIEAACSCWHMYCSH